MKLPGFILVHLLPFCTVNLSDFPILHSVPFLSNRLPEFTLLPYVSSITLHKFIYLKYMYLSASL
jgi:hypothetical protein